MPQQNELGPPAANANSGSSGSHREQTGGSHRSSWRLKTPPEISAAIDLIMSLLAAGLMAAQQGRALLQALKLQLDCARAGQDAPGAADFSGHVREATDVFIANPELLRILASSMSPEALQAILSNLPPRP
jgi:hypothetical protein